MSKKTSKWEEKVDDFYNNYGEIFIEPEELKSFISDLLVKEKMELVSRIEGMDTVEVIQLESGTKADISEFFLVSLADVLSTLKSEEKEEEELQALADKLGVELIPESEELSLSPKGNTEEVGG